jgi:uncharacterized protein
VNRWIEIAPGIRLTGDGAAWLPGERTLVVADVHVGYELAAQRRGGYLPPVDQGAVVGARLREMANELAALRLVIAGDLRHSTRDLDDLERAELARLVDAVGTGIVLDVVRGNHDRGGTIVGRETTGTLRVGDVDVVHVPPASTPERWTVCGHLHPRTTLRDETGAAARFPCAMVGERMIVLPAFSRWAGGASAGRLLDALPAGAWRAIPISDGSIADVGIVVGMPPG